MNGSRGPWLNEREESSFQKTAPSFINEWRTGQTGAGQTRFCTLAFEVDVAIGPPRA